MKTRRGVVLAAVVVAALVLLVVGCEESGTRSSYAPTRTLPALTSPLQATADAIALDAFAAQSAAEVEAAEAAAQATVQAAIHQATVEVAKAQEEQQHWLATQQAAHVTAQAQATADAFAMQMTVQAQAIEATATERAFRATATAQALDRAATATAQHRADAATATAQHRADVATATAQAAAVRATATAQHKADVATATAESYRAAQAALQATATRQAQQRDEVLAVGRDYGIPFVLALGLIGLGLLIVYVVRQIARRPVVYNRSPLGDAPALAAPMPDGGWNIVDLDRQPGHVTRLLPDGTVAAPQFRSAGQEERTTARDQVVDQATRPKLGQGHKGAPSPALPLAPPPTPPAPGLRSVRVLRRLDQAGRAGFLPGPMVASLQADWEVEEQ